jgi:hypothetical protein
VIAEKRRIAFAGSLWPFKTAAICKRLACAGRQISSQIGGFDRRTPRLIYDRLISEQRHLTRRESPGSGESNRAQ